MTFQLSRFACIAALLLAGAPARAGEFSVKPVRLELAAAARSASVTVSNEGQDKLSFQLQAMEWSQDADGKDQYTPTQDLVFYPKIMSVEPGQDGIVRVGLRVGAAGAERTFRLFIEELPGAAVKKPDGNGVQINFLVRFGLPIFAAPVQPQDGLAIEGLDVRNGQVALAVKNTGNRHQMYQGIHLQGLDAAGQRVFGLDLGDRYLLAGVQKSYATTLTPEQCRKTASIGVHVKTDKLEQQRKLDLRRDMCP